MMQDVFKTNSKRAPNLDTREHWEQAKSTTHISSKVKVYEDEKRSSAMNSKCVYMHFPRVSKRQV
jgi:hypothetical protein